ncbi:hypothetical protein ITP53_09735 [Nonomuraea sp. K274]|uniref:Uncharacterized protein n=1 Tax=Nonomuraea cypriaca TaxID=1187855 RepID=A0A931EZB3_9ACTN|nr:hypothetical protein [Nonomuraea cypriaca]MBF8186021.1 hypothetical protein [Nonomuraea cypriaca]
MDVRAGSVAVLDADSVALFGTWRVGSPQRQEATVQAIQAHRDAMEQRPPQLEDDPQWRRAHQWPGLISTTFQRFQPRLHLLAA